MLARAETHERLSRSVFSRIVVGVDGTEAGYEAARQARRLAEPHADIDVVAAKYLAGATLAGWSATRLDEEIARWVDWFTRLFEPMLMAFIGAITAQLTLSRVQDRQLARMGVSN